MRLVAPLAILLLAAALPLGAAQHEGMGGGAGMAMVLHDGPDSGRAVVGGLTHFGFALLDAKGAPVPHQDATFTVEQDGQVVFATSDTHEYDGLFSLDLTFTRPGPYVVTAASGKMMTTNFTGIAVAAANATEAKAVLKTAADGASNAIAATLDVVGPDGKTLPHTDAIVEIRDAKGLLASRWHAHIHDAPIQFTESFGLPGDYAAHVVAYRAFATGKSPDVKAVVADARFTIGPAAVPEAPQLPAAAPGPLEPAGESATDGTFTLRGMYDPQNQVGVGQPIRLAAVIEGKDGMPQPHVDFQLDVAGPRGVAFASKSLHEYDGMLEWLYVPQVPGAYDATLTAKVDDGKSLTVPYHFQVLPPVVPVLGGSGPTTITINGLDKAQAGQPTLLTFHVDNPQGAAGHTEVDVTIFHKGEAPVYQFKLHGHDNATTRAQVVFPHAGDWLVAVDPLPTVPAPDLFVGPAGPGAGIVFEAKVVPGVDAPDAPATGNDAIPAKVPAAGVTLVALGILAATLTARRR